MTGLLLYTLPRLTVQMPELLIVIPTTSKG